MQTVADPGHAASSRASTPPRSGPAPVRLLRVCLDNLVLGGVEVSDTSTLVDVRAQIDEDEIQGVPESYVFLYGGAPVTRRQESRRRALACFSNGFVTIVPENMRIEQPTMEPSEAVASSDAANVAEAPTPISADADVSNFGARPTVHGDAVPIDVTVSMANLGIDDQAASARSAGHGEGMELHFTDGPLEGTTVDVDEEGAHIGRHTSNTLVIPEAGISRYHCEIRLVDGRFCVRDLGSVTGTYFYLKPHGRFHMFVGLMVKVGETELQVLSQAPTGGDSDILEQTVHFFEGPFAGHKVSIPVSGITIGRRHDNHLVLTPDGTVSAHHAAIFSEDGEFYITDLGSCNGTCVRLSPERTDSDWHPIMDGDVLGAGCTKILCRIRAAPDQAADLAAA